MRAQILARIKVISGRRSNPLPIGIDSLMLIFRIGEAELMLHLSILEFEGHISFIPPVANSRGKPLLRIMYNDNGGNKQS